MNSTKISALVALILTAIIATLSIPTAPVLAAPTGSAQRLIIDTRNAAGHASLRADLAKAGNQILIDLPQVNMLVVYGKQLNGAASLAQDSRVAGVAVDGVRSLIRPELKQEFLTKIGTDQLSRLKANTLFASKANKKKGISVPADSAFNLPGLMWDYARIRAQKTWNKLPAGLGQQNIKVGVADTGLDYTHVELTSKIDNVVDLTLTEQPNICSFFFGYPTDQELSDMWGGPADGDWNGHGTWIGGNIAAAMNTWDPTTPYSGTNGIAPAVNLVALKISQNCGSAYDSTILDSFTYAADNGIDVVSISFGGYLDRSNPYNDLIYRMYKRVVNYAWDRGTIIVAAAGNEHTRIGAGGQVISHGILDVPPGGTDYFGLWEVPGGVPKVVMVSATGNVVNGSSESCPGDSLAAGSHQWCKPASDAHQPFGVGKKNQLTYYSNYGPRIDFAAPGGARKFNVPSADRGGCEGWPYCGENSYYGGSSAADGYNAWEEFSITSNWATEIDCFTFDNDPVFPADNCYANIQGTSMATPHVSAAAALVLSNHPEAWKNPGTLYALLKAGARAAKGNTTPPMSKSDKSNTDLTDLPCPDGYCHLGGAAISDADTYGNGLINIFKSAK